MSRLTVREVEQALELPAKRWKGNCYAIATKILAKGLVEGKAQYGHYHGEIAPGSLFDGGPIVRHGWIKTAEHIIDPTRWVFEDVEPYIAYRPLDDPDYDLGGNRFREVTMRPFPPFTPGDEVIMLPTNLALRLSAIFGKFLVGITEAQLFWLANCPLHQLGELAEPVYRWIADDLGRQGLIPLDNQFEVLGPEAVMEEL